MSVPGDAPANSLEFIMVHVIGVSDGATASTSEMVSTVDGSWTIDGLSPGKYYVSAGAIAYDGHFEPPRLLTIYYPNAVKASRAAAVDVTADNASDIVISLEWPGRISGKVTLDPALGIEDYTDVNVWLWGDRGTVTMVDPLWFDGTYVTPPLPADNYVVLFDAQTLRDKDQNSPVQSEFFSSASDHEYLWDRATPVAIAQGRTTEHIDAFLEHGRFTVPGTPQVSQRSLVLGATLGSSPGNWTPAAEAFSYQWKRNGQTIPGATGAQYVLVKEDLGTTLTLEVTGTRADFTSVTVPSAALQIPKIFVAKVPTITGTAKSGYTLTAHRGTWSPAPTYSYQWYRNGVKIPRATGYRYKLTRSDKGKKITVRVTGKRSGYLTTTTVSAARTIAK